ncbi:MAG TPA: ATP synthase F1 subunit epsilon [Deltaproteobacteria bacterium]|nr:ATP synthase F1 subunit epsilon [Deltaproteobacteria bacterium]
MAGVFLLEIVTPQRVVLSKEVEEVTAPGRDGEFGVLREHTPFITTLRPGRVVWKNGAESETFVVDGGFAEVWPDRTNLLVNVAVRGEDVDTDRVKEDLKEAEEKLKALKEDDPEHRKAAERVEFLRLQLELAGGRLD